jgi:hypothetical protein
MFVPLARALRTSSILECEGVSDSKTFSNLKGVRKMLWTIFVILLILWLLGVVSGYTIGSFIHLLLVLALVVLLINIISGRRTVI